MKSVENDHRKVANIESTEFQPWLSDSGEEIGQSLIQINPNHAKGVGFHLYRMAPGTTTESHRHTGDEEFYVIEGELVDNDGTKYVAGDLVWLKEGTEHNSYSEHGCTLVVYIASAEEAVV